MVSASKGPGVPERDATLDAFTSPTDDADGDEEAATESAGATPEGGRTTPAEDGTTSATDGTPPVAEATDVPSATTDSLEATAPASALDPVETTYAWSPDGEECASCGAETARRWRTDAGFVCPGCVDWERSPNG